MQPPAITILGPVGVRGATGPAPRGPGRLLECVIFLALHPSDSPHLLDEAIWPYQRVTPATRNTNLYRARTWLGTQPDGAPWLCHVEEHGYRLAEGVTLDWHTFNEFAPRGELQQVPTDQLRSALSLVQGRPFSNIDPTKYGWADLTMQAIAEAVTSTSAEYLDRLGPDAAPLQITWATSRALAVDPSHERTWQDHLEALLRSGNPVRLAQAARSAHLHLSGVGGISPQTLELLERAQGHQLGADLPAPLED